MNTVTSRSQPIRETVFIPESARSVAPDSVSTLTAGEYADLTRKLNQVEQKQNRMTFSAQASELTPHDVSNISFITQQANRTAMRKEIDEANRKGDKILALLLIALQSGNIEFAMLLFASLESREAAKVTEQLTMALVKAQKARSVIATNIDKVMTRKNQSGIYDLQAQMQEQGDMIQMLSTMIKDINDHKNTTVEFANNFIHNENQTSMNIARGMRG